MLPADTVHPESDRYRAVLVLVPGLWTTPEMWRPLAGYLGHRGWESHLVDPRGRGGIAARGAAVAAYAAGLAVAPVLIGHDAGALVALDAAARVRAAAVVLLAPLVPRRVGGRALGLPLTGVLAVLTGRSVAGPCGGPPDDAALVRDVLWGRLPSRAEVPTLVVVAEKDPLLPAAAARTLVDALAADEQRFAGPARSPLAGPTWRASVDLVHRWLVRRLGESLLELYPEAMAERDAKDED
jgi:pimeloyl-ACP methyl ester carboxylesterase